ncbi:hypothetical protein VPH35_100778 [Triticum aestivum]
MSSSGYVAVPRCSVLFDGTNYAEFAGFMRIHMRGLLLWGVLSGEVPCPPCPVALVAPTPPAPPVLAADASQADRDAAKALDDTAVDAYDQQMSAYSDALSAYRDDLSAYTQWCNDDARAAAVLTASVLPQFASEFMGLGTVATMWSYLCQPYQPSGDALYLSVVRQEHALQQGDSSVDELHGPIWSFSGFTSSYLVFALSSSLAVLTCSLVVVFLSRRYLLSFVLKRPAYALLGYLCFHQCWPPELLCHLLQHSCLLLQGGWVILLMLRGAGRAVTPSVATALDQVTQSLIAVRRSETRGAPLPVGLLDPPRPRHSLTRTL